jgi:RecA/RadA recombinase
MAKSDPKARNRGKGGVFVNKQRRRRMMQQRHNSEVAYSIVESLRRDRIPTSFSGGFGTLGGKRVAMHTLRRMRMRAIAKTKRDKDAQRHRLDEAVKQQENDKIATKLRRQRRVADNNAIKVREKQRASRSNEAEARLRKIRHLRRRRFERQH